MSIKKLFTEHPASVGETYTQHLIFAAKAGTLLVIAGTCCLIHSIFPFWFQDTASKTVERINQAMRTREF